MIACWIGLASTRKRAQRISAAARAKELDIIRNRRLVVTKSFQFYHSHSGVNRVTPWSKGFQSRSDSSITLSKLLSANVKAVSGRVIMGAVMVKGKLKDGVCGSAKRCNQEPIVFVSR